ncbi:MAG: PPOX class F420-dependent oxidoreductase [Sporichthyaceae bacterium]
MARTIATNTRVELAELLETIRPRHRMVLITRRDDGGPQASPVTGGVDLEGRIVIATYPERAKVRNVKVRPIASVLVLSDEWNGPWVQVDGIVEIVDAADDVEPFVDYFRCIGGEHSDWEEYRQAMRDQGKSLLRITPTRWGPIATGGFPARLVS